MKGKRGLTESFLVALLIVAISFVLILGTVARFMSTAEEKETEVLCRDSIALRAASALRVSDTTIQYTSPLCKTIEKKIKPRGSDEREDVKRQIADSMARCWWMFGEGRYDENIFQNTPALFSSDAQCFMCYAIVVDEGNDFDKNSEGISTLEFRNYLRETKYDREQVPYLEYIQQHKTGGPGYVVSILTEEGIKPNHAYAVAFKAKHEDQCKTCALTLGAAAGGKILGIKGAIIGGIAAFTASAMGEALQDTYQLDGIILMDWNSPQFRDIVRDKCNFVADIGGT